VPASECRAANGLVGHGPSARALRFGEVAEAAAKIPPPVDIKLKDPKDWALIGTPRKRFDVPDKVTGRTIYGIDVRLPNMLHAAIRHCPVFGGCVDSIDDGKVVGMRGVRRVVTLPDAVAVVADSWWQAEKALQALAVTWKEGENARVSSASIRDFLRAGLTASDAAIGHQAGNVVSGLAQAVNRIEADYAVPFLAHATMEPQNCTAHVTRDKIEIWAPTQDGETALATAASAADVPLDKVVVHKMMLGGGFGRRGMVQDFVREAVLIAKDVGQPVKLVWTREEDMRHDFYRPAVMARLTAGLDSEGMPTALQVRIAGPSIVAFLAPSFMKVTNDRSFLQGFLEDFPYGVPNFLSDYAMRNTPVPVGVWRSVNHSQNAFFKESFIDEMSHAAGQDPYLYRRKLLAQKPKHLAVLDAAARKAGWGWARAPGVFRGIALHEGMSSICAQVVEASVENDGMVRIHRIVAAIDSGFVVNPLTVEMQTEGAIVYGLTAALYGEISIKDGRAEQSNFDDYEMLRMAQMPKVETVIVPSGGFWGGVGEPPVAPVAPALCNAIFAATGNRIRSLPLKNHNLRFREL
jgi:isoquinoline 1-oxidoreductase beta subunit